MRPIHYEPHPVSPERKAELLADGVKIIDARFKPAAEAVADEPGIAVEAPRKSRKAKE